MVLIDDGSTDNSRDICRANPDVAVVDFQRRHELLLNEPDRYRVRFDAAREQSTDLNRVIFILDADEMLSANFATDLRRVAEAPPGTMITARWANLLPGLDRCIISDERCAFGYVDDGAAYAPSEHIHGPRIPTGPELHLEDTVLLHYKFAAPRRARARLRWYQVLETIYGTSGALDQYRMYHRGEIPDSTNVRSADPEWFEGYERAGIDMRRVPDGDSYFTRLALDLIEQHGAERFRRADIWDVDWSAIAAAEGKPLARPIPDPRGTGTRLAHAWLRVTQNRRESLATRLGERLLRDLGW